MTGAVAAAPAAGATSAPAAPASGTPTTTAKPAAGAESTPQAPAQGAQSQAKPPAAPKTETAEQKRIRLALKKGAPETEYTHEELVRKLQHLEGLQSERSQTLKQKQEVEALFERLKTDPDGLMRERGFDADAWIEAQAKRKAEMDALSPIERQLRDANDKIQKFEQAEAQRAEQAKADAETAADRELVTGNLRTFAQAIDASGLIPPLPPNASQADRVRHAARRGYLMKLYGEVREMAIHNGEPDFSPEQLAREGERLELKRVSDVIERHGGNEAWRTRNASTLAGLGKLALGQIIPTMDGASLIQFLGRPMAAQIAKALYEAQINRPTPIVQEPPHAQETQAAQPNGKTLTEWDIADRLGMR